MAQKKEDHNKPVTVNDKLTKMHSSKKKGNAFLRQLMCYKFLMLYKIFHLVRNIYIVLSMLFQFRVGN